MELVEPIRNKKQIEALKKYSKMKVLYTKKYGLKFNRPTSSFHDGAGFWL